jgi:hypothetical protein
VSNIDKEAAVIEGLKLDVPAEELAQRLSTSIAWHAFRAGGCDDRLQRLGRIDSEFQAVDRYLEGIGWSGGQARLAAALERKRTHHRRRASALEFVRDHLAKGEVYRLGLDDLRLTGLFANVSW